MTGVPFGTTVLPPEASTDYAWLTPLVSGLTGQFADPVREAEVLRVQLQEARIRGRSLVAIRTLEARLLAAERRAGLAIESSSTMRGWNQVGQVAAVAGIGLLLTGIAYVGLKAVGEARRLG